MLTLRNPDLVSLVRGFQQNHIDSDDYIHPCFFEWLISASQSTGADCAMCGFQTFEDISSINDIFPENLDRSKIQTITLKAMFSDWKQYSICTARIIKKSEIGDIRFSPDYPIGEDSLFTAELCYTHPSIHFCFIPYNLYYYFQRSNSASKTNSESRRLNVYSLFLQRAGQSEISDIIYLDQSIRGALNIRNVAAYIHPNADIVSKCNTLLKTNVRKLIRSTIYSFPRKSLYLLSIYSTWFYRWYRYRRDPSLKRWEKVTLESRKSNAS